MKRRVPAKRVEPKRTTVKLDASDRVISVDEQLRQRKQREQIVRFLDRGLSQDQIADALKITTKTVYNVKEALLADYIENEPNIVSEFLSSTIRNFNSLKAIALPRALGYITEAGVEVPPDVKWFAAVVKMHKDLGHLLGVGKTNVEVTGANGGPIRVTRDVDNMTDDELAALISARTDDAVAAVLAAQGGGGGGGKAPPRDPLH